MKQTPRGKRLWLLYRITEADYETLLSHQTGLCAGCSRPAKGIRLSVDHDHATGKIRGVLCMACNKALGYLRDDPQTAMNLAAYLTNPPAPLALGREVYGMTGRAMVGKKVKKYGPPPAKP